MLREEASNFLSTITDNQKYRILREELIKTDLELLSSVLAIKKFNTPSSKGLETDPKGLEAYLTDEVLKNIFSFGNTRRNGFDLDLDKEKSKTDVSKKKWKVVDPEYQKINVNFSKFFMAKNSKKRRENGYVL